jgi:hypothetical protein
MMNACRLNARDAGPSVALATPFAWPASGLEPLPWFPFTVAASSGQAIAAARIAQRTERAYWYLRKALSVTPRFRLLVLDANDWAQHAEVSTFGVTHVTADGHLVVGSEPADAWHDVSRYLAKCLPPATVKSLVIVHGADAVYPDGPDLSGVAEALIAHELAHVIADQAGADFGRRWLAEAFADYALVAMLGETDPSGLHRIGTLAEAARMLADATPTVAEFEAAAGSMAPAASILVHLDFTRAGFAAYADAQATPLARWFELARNGQAALREPDADHELGPWLARNVHPAFAQVAARRNGWQEPAARAA